MVEDRKKSLPSTNIQAKIDTIHIDKHRNLRLPYSDYNKSPRTKQKACNGGCKVIWEVSEVCTFYNSNDTIILLWITVQLVQLYLIRILS